MEMFPADSLRPDRLILFIDPDRISRDAVQGFGRALFPGFAVAAAEDVPSLGPGEVPALIVVDAKDAPLDGTDGMADRIRELSRRWPEAPILVMSGAIGDVALDDLLRLGINGCVPHAIGVEAFAAVARLMLDGGTYYPRVTLFRDRDAPGRPAPAPSAPRPRVFDPALRSGSPPMPARSDARRLTDREHEVIRKLKQGKPNKIIAYELGISISTVKVHVRNILRKAGATNRIQAALDTRLGV